MKYISAGHCNVQGPNYDSGAPGVNGRLEANETVKLRDLVVAAIIRKGYIDIVKDINSENRNQYFKRIVTGSGSTVVEFHFNAGPPDATGTEALVGVDADRLDKSFAGEMSTGTSKILAVKNRGIKSEADTRHKRLGLMRETGIVCLVEVCFISNSADMKAYDMSFQKLAEYYADVIIKYDEIIK
jgi:N-acetylmuramoyl-L-alanine amidase